METKNAISETTPEEGLKITIEFSNEELEEWRKKIMELSNCHCSIEQAKSIIEDVIFSLSDDESIENLLSAYDDDTWGHWLGGD